MHRVLIADPSELFGKAIAKQLQDEFCVRVCQTGRQTLELIRTFDPDILLLDTMLPDVSSLTILQTLQSAGSPVKIIGVSCVINEFLMEQLSRYGISCLLSRPCTVAMAVCQIRDISFQLDHPDQLSWCLENEIDRILLQLSFRMGPARYRCVFEAILARYYNFEISMKELYIDVAKCCGGNYQRVEKAIRDAVADAYECGDKEIWAMYFPADAKRDKPYPGNEDFIGRIAGCLTQRARIKKPYIHTQEMVK